MPGGVRKKVSFTEQILRRAGQIFYPGHNSAAVYHPVVFDKVSDVIFFVGLRQQEERRA